MYDPNAPTVAILGGAFNPPTSAHIQLAAEIVHSDQTDEVWLVPCGARPDKPNMITTPEERYTMCEIAVNSTVSPTFPIKVSDHEVRNGSMATYDSLRWLSEHHPGINFCWVIGTDWLTPGNDLRTWESKEGKTGDKLVSEFGFFVMPRPGYDVEGNDLSVFGPRFEWLSLPAGFRMVESTASSTEVRRRAKKHWETDESSGVPNYLEGLVPAGVLAFILRRGLYKHLAAKPAAAAEPVEEEPAA
eukprot:NODE_13823_length_1144_cov_15.960669.p1 GENE.NODE_13823_length_1144_cov_15.960669~~NODE_13823_length_1144_cov_15.960669.p1  ORF type:complete len:245 (-),score=34.40 NODE_13823_length_1144_cov_15.960669:282-1016(-)